MSCMQTPEVRARAGARASAQGSQPGHIEFAGFRRSLCRCLDGIRNRHLENSDSIHSRNLFIQVRLLITFLFLFLFLFPGFCAGAVCSPPSAAAAGAAAAGAAARSAHF